MQKGPVDLTQHSTDTLCNKKDQKVECIVFCRLSFQTINRINLQTAPSFMITTMNGPEAGRGCYCATQQQDHSARNLITRQCNNPSARCRLERAIAALRSVAEELGGPR